MTTPRTRIAVFASGEGTNFQAILDGCATGHIPGEVVLLVSNKPQAKALQRARDAKVPTLVLPYKDDDAYSAALLKACQDAQAQLICLAGHLTRVPPKFLASYKHKVLNVHPALLPAFGGKGFYGAKVHQAVLESGARVSGATVHLVDEEYDHGPAVLQQTVPVFDQDTPETLASRVHEAEYAIYPRAVRLACQGRLHVDGGRVRIKAEVSRPGEVRRALVSVSDKTGVGF